MWVLIGFSGVGYGGYVVVWVGGVGGRAEGACPAHLGLYVDWRAATGLAL